jgi:hypothetical protein
MRRYRRLEPCAAKVARTVLRGLGGGNIARLPGTKPDSIYTWTLIRALDCNHIRIA